MIEFIQESFFTVNLPITLLLLLVIAYWLMAIIGLVGVDWFDLEADVDGDLHSGAILKGFTNFFYLSDIPIAIVGSFFVLFLWIVTMLSNHYLNPQQSFWITGMWLIPNILLSLAATKLVSMPLVKIFENRDRPITRDEFFGKVGRITTSVVTAQAGQMEIEQKGPPILLNVRAKAGIKLVKGDLAKIIGYNEQNDTFLVELTKWEKP
jgi:hypothetical protein